jgi:hypothetical protein
LPAFVFDRLVHELSFAMVGQVGGRSTRFRGGGLVGGFEAIDTGIFERPRFSQLLVGIGSPLRDSGIRGSTTFAGSPRNQAALLFGLGGHGDLKV